VSSTARKEVYEMKVLILVSCVVMLELASQVAAQSWRRLVPLHSSCEDAQKVLKLSKCDAATVELEDVRVFVSFSDGTCRTEWNVPAGTVLTMDIRPKKTLMLSDLDLDLTKYSRGADQGLADAIVLSDPLAGISITAFKDGRIRHVFYGPSAKDEYLRCQTRETSDDTGEPGFMKVDQYGFVSFDAEVPRLDQLAETLKGWSGARAYIIVYPGGNTGVEEAKKRASSSQMYLVNNRRVDMGRVVTLIGGNREEPAVELFIVVKNGTPPEPIPKRIP
jgi:hypothetical protein